MSSSRREAPVPAWRNVMYRCDNRECQWFDTLRRAEPIVVGVGLMIEPPAICVCGFHPLVHRVHDERASSVPEGATMTPEATIGMTAADLAEVLRPIGVSIKDVSVDGLRIAAAAYPDDPLSIEMQVYCHNDKGERYFDPLTAKAAVETRRFRLAVLALADDLTAR